MNTPVYIMFGGNIGDVDATFAAAEKYISARGFVPVSRSRAGVSAAVDCVPETPDFKDMALAGFWNGSAEELLDLLQETERFFGRPADHRSDMSRTLDCDLIFFGNGVIRTSRLTVPHPRLHNRLFVLEVLVEIAPDFIHPVLNRSVKELFDELTSANAGR